MVRDRISFYPILSFGEYFTIKKTKTPITIIMVIGVFV